MKSGVRVDRHSLGGAKQAWCLGRSPEQADIVMNHDSVSRRHALVHRLGMFLFVSDLASAHGTFVDGQRLEKNSPVRLSAGANIRFGCSTRIFVYREPPLHYDGGGKLQSPAARKLP